MSDGHVVEFDEPHALLRDPKSVFSGMVNETGPANATLLREMARNASVQRLAARTATQPSSSSIDVKIQS